MKHANQTSGRRAGKIENVLLAGILLFSIWGGYYFLRGEEDTITPLPPAQFTLSSSEQGIAAGVVSTGSPETDHLVVYGSPKAGAPLQFDILNYNRNARYKISFGDGHLSEVRSSSVQHTYGTPGTFRLQVWIKQEEKEEMLYTGALHIRESADLAQRD